MKQSSFLSLPPFFSQCTGTVVLYCTLSLHYTTTTTAARAPIFPFWQFAVLSHTANTLNPAAAAPRFDSTLLYQQTASQRTALAHYSVSSFAHFVLSPSSRHTRRKCLVILVLPLPLLLVVLVILFTVLLQASQRLKEKNRVQKTRPDREFCYTVTKLLLCFIVTLVVFLCARLPYCCVCLAAIWLSCTDADTFSCPIGAAT